MTTKKTPDKPCLWGCGKKFEDDEALASHHMGHRKDWLQKTFTPENLKALADMPETLHGLLKKHL